MNIPEPLSELVASFPAIPPGTRHSPARHLDSAGCGSISASAEHRHQHAVYIQGGHPTAQQIGAYMKRRGWSEHTDESETQDYIHHESRQLIRDAHPGNWIKQRGTAEMMPVDISTEQF